MRGSSRPESHLLCFTGQTVAQLEPVWLPSSQIGISGHGLRVIVGLPWEQHVAFLDDPVTVNRIIASVREGVARCVGHAAVFCYAIGNEICAPVARWHGKRRIERFLARLGDVVRGCDPSALVTYVN